MTTDDKIKKKIAICFDFDCTVTAFHYYMTYNWGHDTFFARNEIAQRFRVNNVSLMKQYKMLGMNILNNEKLNDLYELMHGGSMAAKQQFIVLLFGGRLKHIVEKLKSIKTIYGDVFEIDYYIATLGRYETFVDLFGIMRSLGSEYAEFLDLFLGIYMTNSPVEKYYTDTIPHLFCDMNFQQIHGGLGLLEQNNTFNQGKAYFVDCLIEQYAYDALYIIDDSRFSSQSMDYLVCMDHQGKGYEKMIQGKITYIQPGNERVNSYNHLYKEIGNHVLIRTLDSVLIPLLSNRAKPSYD
jgi:hypothetical protein